MEDFLCIGQVSKPQGVRGEIKVKPYGDELSSLLGLKKATIESETYKVLNVRIFGDAFFLVLSGIADRDKAETLRGKSVFATREDLPPLKDGEYYIADVIGSSLVDENGLKIGVVEDIDRVKTDVYTVRKDNGKIFRFPLLKDLLIKIDVEEKTVIVNAKRLGEVSVYED